MAFSVIIPTFNSMRHIDRCLASVFYQLPPGTEVIAVDNGSADSTPFFIKKRYPEVTLIINDKNMGSSYARNQGISASKGDYLIFIDSDASLKENFFVMLKDILGRLPPGVCGISPMILKRDTGKIFSCGLSISPIYRVHDIGAGREEIRFSESFPIDGPNSCCAVFKRGALDKVRSKRGCFDEDFFFLFEDADLAIRLKEAGYKSLFMPKLVCYHYGNGSDTPGQFRRYLCFRNRLYIIMKAAKKGGILSFFLRSFIYDFFRTLHFAATNRYFLRLIKDIRRKNEKDHRL